MSRQRKIPPVRERAFALVVVLSFVVLLTVLLVSFFSRAIWQRGTANSSLNQAKADELARSALDLLTSDLKQEIADPTASTATTANNVTVYTPLAAANMVPVRNAQVTGTTAIPNLIRISSGNAISAPGVDQQASGAVSTGTSQNGRTVSLARWNQHYLIPLKTPGTPTDTTPVAGFAAPNWVYITSNGGPTSPPVSTPSSNVVGRYAYAMYDESGLLDMNVAGYPADPSTTTVPPAYAPKGGLAFADLTKLIASGTTPLITQAGVNNLVGWRNYASLTNGGLTFGGAFPSLTLTGSTVPTVYRTAMLANTNGFLKASTTAAATGQTDQAFHNRQELINLALAIYQAAPTSFNPTALQYLGTFSRGVNAPSWAPATPTGSTIDYAQQSKTPTPDTSTAVNRDLANVRFSTAGTVTHYNDDGTTSTYQVSAGDPLIQRRFSLAKLAWLTPSGPAAGKTAAVTACFGLTWQSGPWYWEYSAASTSPVGIKTLSQVASETPPREPNFFELLKAGILTGSLGRDPGKGCDASGVAGVGVYAGEYDTYKTERNLQILQIGANIIDQFDTDSYPTAIHLSTFAGLAPADDYCIQTVYGIENLPYPEGLQPIAIADPVPPSAASPGTLKFWLQPSLWNPHQPPVSALTGYPSSFRVYAYGGAYVGWNISGGTLRYGPVTTYDDGGAGSSLGSVYFNNPADATSPFYSTPLALTLNMPSGSIAAIVDQTNTPTTNYYMSKWSGLPADGGNTPNQFAGIALAADTNYNPNPSTDVVNKYLVPNPVLYVSLQYKGTDGNYHPYSFMGRMEVSGSKLKFFHPGPELTLTVPGQTNVSGWGPERPDPRTDRFGESVQWWGQSKINLTMNTGPSAYRQPEGSAAGGTFAIPYLPSSFTYLPTYTAGGSTGGAISHWAENDKNSSITPNAYYSDPDGIVRYGDDYRWITASGDGCEMYLGSATVSPVNTLTSTATGSAKAHRPVVLNRPLRSVGELGFAFRDLPFKTLDFWSPTSADAALLDLFAVADAPTVTAGQINLAAVTVPVLRAILSGTFKSDALATQMSDTDVQSLCAKIANDVTANGPYKNRADLATRLGPLVAGPSSATYGIDTSVTANYNWVNKAYAEAPIRALADVTNTRTWNVMIDVIAQSGVFPPNATDISKGFVVQGERRYWLHVAIDRYTGKVVDQQLEPVYE